MHEVKGKAKEMVGRSTGNRSWEVAGQVEEIGGKVQKKIAHIEKALGK